MKCLVQSRHQNDHPFVHRPLIRRRRRLLASLPKSSSVAHKFITRFKSVFIMSLSLFEFLESQNQDLSYPEFLDLFTAVLHCTPKHCQFLKITANMWSSVLSPSPMNRGSTKQLRLQRYSQFLLLFTIHLLFPLDVDVLGRRENKFTNNLYNKDKLLFSIFAVLSTFKQSKWAILLSEHMLVFTGKCFPCTGKK